MKKSEETQKNWLKRFERKVAEGRIGKFISWFDFIREKSVIGMKDFQQYEAALGRIGNRVYCLGDNGRYILFKKFKNATKAKRFMAGVK